MSIDELRALARYHSNLGKVLADGANLAGPGTNDLMREKSAQHVAWAEGLHVIVTELSAAIAGLRNAAELIKEGSKREDALRTDKIRLEVENKNLRVQILAPPAVEFGNS